MLLNKNNANCWAWWHTPVTPAGLLDQPGLHSQGLDLRPKKGKKGGSSALKICQDCTDYFKYINKCIVRITLISWLQMSKVGVISITVLVTIGYSKAQRG